MLTLVFITANNFLYFFCFTNKADSYNPGYPGRIWTNVTTLSYKPVLISLLAEIRIETNVVNRSRVWIDDKFKGRFEVFVFRGRNTLFSWSQNLVIM